MPALSERAIHLPASPIRKLVPYAEAAKKRGTAVYHLNIGQPDIETPPGYFEAIRQADIKVLAYSHSAGNESLRAAIARYYDRLGIGLTTSQIIVTTGASEALGFVFAACMNPGDEVIIPEPFYANYNSFSIFSNIKVVPIVTEIEDSFALPPIEAFEALITPRTRAILICNPGNPTGILYPQEALEKLKAIALKHDLYLISDEVYREFAYDGLQHQSVLSLTGADENTIVVDSISKRFSACGARIGCVVSRNAGVMDAVMRMAQARLSPPTFGQIGAEAVYDLPPSFYEGIVSEYVSRRDLLLSRLRQIPGVLCPQVNGAFYAMVRLPVDDSEKFCQWMLESFSHHGATVMMAPGNGFYADPSMGKDEVRVAYVLNRQDLDAAMDCLEAGLKAYPGYLG
ncbi:MAG: pyridoxal phosphate-dependent aminotransferase [Bacteroidia bacterium]|nr:pyridoxal phosphate-dependent aminotransferase [Bacteroidia bacterium]